MGGTGKTFDGTANLSWSLAEIGAQPLTRVVRSTNSYQVNASTPQTLLDASGKEVSKTSSYLVRLVVTNTGTITGNIYTLRADNNGNWILRALARSGTDSNHPELSINASGKPQITTKHPSTYNIVAIMEEFDQGTHGGRPWFDLESFYSPDNKPTPAALGAVDKAGDTMTGNLTTPKVLVSGTQGTEVNALTRKDYVDSAIAAGDALQVSKAGDTMTGGLTFVNAASELGWSFNTDYAKIGFKNTADGDTDSYMWFKTGDNGNEYFKWQGVSGANTTDWMSLKSTGLVVAAGVTAPTFTGALAGNAATATKLATARQINGTNFDGSDNITTANWGTARTLTIGDAAKSVNGGADVAWSLDEIRAASAIPLIVGSSVAGRKSCRLLTIGRTDNSCAFVIAAQGDFGTTARGWYQISVATRGGTIRVDAYAFNANDSADPLKIYTIYTGTVFEVWGEFSDYNNNSSILICSNHGATFLAD